MTITANPHELLHQAANVLQERAQTHGDFENNFQLIADIFSLRIGRDFHPYEVCILLECVKDARMFANPVNVDNYLDGINYRAFAALFAQDYVGSQAASAGVAYIKKTELKKAELKPVEVLNKSAVKVKLPQPVTAGNGALNLDALEKEIIS
jgi:hypothetical protein